MLAREEEVRDVLRADEDLAALASGGVYAFSELGTEGLNDSATTPDVWTGGVFNACIVVKQRRRVPTGQLSSTKWQVTDTQQIVMVWAYAYDETTVEAIQDACYALLQGYKLSDAWRCEYVEESDIMQAPELPVGIKQQSQGYAVRALRRAA